MLDDATPASSVPSSYPPALAKACEDEFDYALGLRDGTVIFFTGAVPVSDSWVTLNGVTNGPSATRGGGDSRCATFERGLDVNLAHIAWVADAPHGS